jgi:hypothetical protein
MIERRGRGRRPSRALFGVGALAAVTTAAAPVYAVAPAVALGEVSTRVVRSDLDLGEALRVAVEGELGSLQSAHAGKRGPVVLSASLVRVDAEGGRVTCVVSATIRTARGGDMIAIVEGRAGVETDAPVTAAVVRSAVSAAARAAIVRVPDALR